MRRLSVLRPRVANTAAHCLWVAIAMSAVPSRVHAAMTQSAPPTGTSTCPFGANLDGSCKPAPPVPSPTTTACGKFGEAVCEGDLAGMSMGDEAGEATPTSPGGSAPSAAQIGIDDPNFVGVGGGGAAGANPSHGQPPGPPIKVSTAAMKCGGGASSAADCKSCSAGASNVVGCGVSDAAFATVAVQALASGSDMVISAKGNTDTASNLISTAGPGAGGVVLGGSAGGSGGTNSLSTTGAKTSASPADGNGADANSVSGYSGLGGGFKAGAGGGATIGGGGREDGGEGAADGGHTVTDLSAEKGGSASTQAAGAGSVDGLGAGRPGFDPENSDTWTEDEKEARLAAALALDPDLYFAMIRRNRSIFEQVHERYAKIQMRGFFRVAGPMPASLAPGKALK